MRQSPCWGKYYGYQWAMGHTYSNQVCKQYNMLRGLVYILIHTSILYIKLSQYKSCNSMARSQLSVILLFESCLNRVQRSGREIYFKDRESEMAWEWLGIFQLDFYEEIVDGKF